MRYSALGLLAAFGLAACGGDEPAADTQTPATDAPAAEAPAATGALTMPDWYQIDRDARTVTLDITAGTSSDNNYWNYNGLYGGRGHVVIPQGYQVTVNLTNNDPNMAHSIGIGERQSSYPATFPDPQPVFAGGITENASSMTEGTMPGESESISFTAETAGDYAFICYVAGHAVVGMYLNVTVSADDEAGFRE